MSELERQRQSALREMYRAVRKMKDLGFSQETVAFVADDVYN
jgi:hypothetical protein